ncbi:hypothetical protein V6N13_011037 [Hibiscus sabdariffa]|uniref:Uncharacterized protein n=1 Tax=Hibiscus sabdariffa TaxID=183260 RepID=A0ABR2SB26_9ROSI
MASSPAQGDALGKLKYLSVVSKVSSELESHVECADKVLAEFITDMGRYSGTVDEFDGKLKENGAELPDYFVRTLLTIIHAILLPEVKAEKESKKENAADGKKSKFKALAIADDKDRAKELEKEIEMEARDRRKVDNRDRERDRDRDRRYRDRDRDKDRGTHRDRYKENGNDDRKDYGSRGRNRDRTRDNRDGDEDNRDYMNRGRIRDKDVEGEEGGGMRSDGRYKDNEP